MLFTQDIDIPKNTLKSAPVIEIVPIAKGIISWVSLQFPPGCARLAHCIVLFHEHQIFPSTDGMDLAGDSYPIEWGDYYEVYQPPYELKIKGWNEDDTYPHKIAFRVAVLPRKAVLALAIADTISGMMGYLSPRRIFSGGS